MRKLSDKAGPQAIDRALRIAEIRLAGHPAVAERAEQVRAVRARLKAALEAREGARVAAQVMTAELRLLDERVDAAVQRLARAVREVVDDGGDAALYARAFPQAPSVATRPMASAAQGVYVRNALHAVQGVEAGRVAERAGELAAAQDALDVALAGRAPLVDADVRGRGEVRLVAEDARRFYNHLQIELLAAFPHERALAASFFG